MWKYKSELVTLISKIYQHLLTKVNINKILTHVNKLNTSWKKHSLVPTCIFMADVTHTSTSSTILSTL